MDELRKEISLVTGIAQLSTTLLGTGLFMIPAIAAGIAGEVSLWAWVVLFIAVCPVALTFAQLGKRYPNAGGTAYFVRLAFNRNIERSVARLFISVIPVGVPAAVALAASFLQVLLPDSLNNHLFAQIITICCLMLVSLLGSKSSGQLQVVVALALIALVGGFFWRGEISLSDMSMPPLDSSAFLPLGSALAVMFWCFVGIEAFAHMGEEFKNPQRDFPIAIVIGCLFAGFIYWAMSVVILKYNAYGTPDFDSGAIPWLSQYLFGSNFALVISVLGFSASFASVNLYTQSLSRMVWAQAREYHASGRLSTLSTKGVPKNATLLVGSVLAVSCIIGYGSGLNLEFFLKLANGVFVLIYLMAMLAAYRLLDGWAKYLAAIALGLCLFVFICLGWAMLYAVAVFGILILQQHFTSPQKAID